jgi:hypothetical protein
MRGAGDMAIAEVLPSNHRACSTSVAAFGWLAVHRWVVHVGRAGATVPMLASWTVVYGMTWGDTPICS